jgi:crotonobetainyl-CoA:carnitine CoA-transferase CaiB-like acyl-CoA transferase
LTAPLEGVRVVELAEGVAGPLAARLLGDAGADVLKVETGSGDRARAWAPQVGAMSATFATLNRNKRSIVVDSPAAPEVATLGALGDVLIVDDDAGVDVDGLSAANANLVVCVVSGWGPEGPWAGRSGGELPAQLATETTTSLGRPGEEPVRIGTDHAGVACALYAFQAVTAALLVADGGGQRVDVSLFGSLLHMRTALWVALSNPDEWWGFHLDSYTKAPEHFYTCKDRRVIFQVQRVPDMVALVKDLHMEWVLEDPRWEMFRVDTGALGRFSSRVHDLWDRGLSQWTFAEAAAIFERHGGTVFPCLAHEEFLTDPQVEHLGLAVDTGGPIADIRPPWQFSATPATIRRPAPRLDEHGAEIREGIVAARRWEP